MFTIFGGRGGRFCDGLSRRSFIQVGAMGFGGLMLPDLLRAEAAAGRGSSHKALINVFLAGGPPHQDMWDLKPQAPSEYRGEFMPTATNVPGMAICELMPKLASMADRFALIRSIVGMLDEHSNHQTETGYRQSEPLFNGVGGFPSIGSVVAKLKGTPNDPAPAFVSLTGDVTPGFLGPVYQPYRPDGEGRSNLKRHDRVNESRLADRQALLKQLDGLRRDIDRGGEMHAMDKFGECALGVITSGRLADALDLQKEPLASRQRYGLEDANNRRRGDSQRFLIARRLIEAGVRCVSLHWGGWDTHDQNFRTLREQLPSLDTGLSALIGDLEERGMLDDTTIVVWGEFGRTPKVNGNSGRDHWSRVASAFLAGGGMKTGQVIGSTDRYAGEAVDRPVHLREIIATLYHNLGIDARNTTLIDTAGRPQYLVDARDPIAELI